MTAAIAEPIVNERSDDGLDELRARVDAAANQTIIGLSCLTNREKVKALLG